MTSCNWSDRCFFDFSSNWFEPRAPISTNGTLACSDPESEGLLGNFNATLVAMAGSTAKGLAQAAVEEVKLIEPPEWTGLGLEWLRKLLGARLWRIECMDMYIRL